MTHQEILNKTKAEIDLLCDQAKEKLDAMAPKALEIGKWYKQIGIFSWLFCYQGLDKKNYGFVDSRWRDDFGNAGNNSAIEATPQEVEKALIKEAKRRGFVNGGLGNNSNIHDKKLKNCELFFNNQYEFDEKDNLLRVILDSDTTWTVFKGGKWATIIEQDKFAELKEAHSKGAVIQWNNCGVWVTTDYPEWNNRHEYRIKPEEKPKAGDVCKFWNYDENNFEIAKLVRVYSEKETYKYASGASSWINAKTLTQQETIDLLFNNK